MHLLLETSLSRLGQVTFLSIAQKTTWKVKEKEETEAYASKNPILPSIFDAIGMGLGFTVALFLIGTFREILGAGQFLGIQVITETIKPASIMILAPGAFFTLGGLMVILNAYNIKKAAKTGEEVKPLEHNCGSCSGCGTKSCGTSSGLEIKETNKN